MELLQLTYFCDAAESQNFTKTAQKFGVPASNISQTVHRLETELGVALFDRRANKATLNEAGKVFYKKVKQALCSIEEGRLRINDLKGVVSGEVRLLILTNRNTVTKAIERFKKKYPQAVFSVSHRLDNAEDEFDFIISDRPPFGRKLEKRLIITDEMMLAVQKGSKWDRDDLKLSDLKNERFISMHSNSSLYRTASKICNEAGFVPNIAIQSDDPYYMRKYVELGMGVAIVPSVSWKGLFSENVVLKSLGGKRRGTYIYSDPEKYMPAVVRLFLDELLSVCEQLK
ncbi:MAG: LysR family transcriptional regulator [Clostridia bacterium]|nr:LysR family transcriptional regulator [Clostridia bacterium]